MTEPRPEKPVRVGSKIALGLAVVATVALTGAVAGPPGLVAGLVAALAAVGAGASLRALVRDSNRSRATGSVGLALSGAAVSSALVGLLVVSGLPEDSLVGHPMTESGDAVPLALATAGVLAAATDAFVESPAAAVTRVTTTLWRSAHVLAVGAVLGYLAGVGLFTDVPLAALGALADALAAAGDSTPLGNAALVASFVGLQVLALVVVWLVRTAVPVLNEWVASATTSREDETEVDGLLSVLPDPVELPASVWGLLGVQVFLAVLVGDLVGGLFGTVLETLGPLGGLVRWGLSAGVVHWPLVLVGLLALGVLAADGARRLFVFWAGRNPPTTLAFAAGGVAGVALGTVGGLLTMTAEAALGESVGGHLVAPGVAAAVGVGMVGAVVLAAVPERIARLVGVRRASGFAGGAGALFVAGLWVAVVGLGGASDGDGVVRLLVPLAAIAGVAASVLVWDLGENAVSLRHQLGRDTDTRDAELTHAVASVLVAGGGVVLAGFAYYLAGPLLFTQIELGPLSLPNGLVGIGPDRAFVALGLAIVALLAFGFLIDRGQDPGPGAE